MSKPETPSLSPEIVAACKELVAASMRGHMPTQDPRQDHKDGGVFRSITIPGTITGDLSHGGGMMRVIKQYSITKAELAEALGVDVNDEQALKAAIIRTAFPDNITGTETDATKKQAILFGLQALNRTSIQVLDGEPIFEYRIPGPMATHREARVRDAIKAYGEDAVRTALGADLFDRIIGKSKTEETGVIDGTFTEIRAGVNALMKR